MARLIMGVKHDMLTLWDTASEKLLEEQAITLSEYWRRLVAAFSRHGLEGKLKVSKPKRDRNGNPYIMLTFNGERKNGDGSRGGEHTELRNAEIAFYNEYGTQTRGGKQKVPKRLWMRTANNAAEPELAKIAEKYGENDFFFIK